MKTIYFILASILSIYAKASTTEITIIYADSERKDFFFTDSKFQIDPKLGEVKCNGFYSLPGEPEESAVIECIDSKNKKLQGISFKTVVACANPYPTGIVLHHPNIEKGVSMLVKCSLTPKSKAGN